MDGERLRGDGTPKSRVTRRKLDVAVADERDGDARAMEAPDAPWDARGDDVSCRSGPPHASGRWGKTPDAEAEATATSPVVTLERGALTIFIMSF